MAITLKFPRNPRIKQATKIVSTAYSADTAIAYDVDLTNAGFTTATTTTIQIAGILQQTVASTDSDYADASMKRFLVDEDGEWLVTAATTAAAADDVGGYVDFASSAGTSVDPGTSTTDTFFITRFVSTVLLIGCFSSWQSRYSPAAD